MGFEEFKKLDSTIEVISADVIKAIDVLDKDKNYSDDLRNKILSSILEKYNQLPDDPTIRAGFVYTIEDQVKIIISKFNLEAAKNNFLNQSRRADEKINEIHHKTSPQSNNEEVILNKQ